LANSPVEKHLASRADAREAAIGPESNRMSGVPASGRRQPLLGTAVNAFSWVLIGHGCPPKEL
jgi:hypothetical protein